MEDLNYPEINTLKEMIRKHNIKISVSQKKFLGNKEGFHAVSFTLGGKTFEIYADDELSDFDIKDPILDLLVVLRELAYYKNCYDYDLWCSEQMLDLKDITVLSYYRSLGGIYREIEHILGKIDPLISDWDFEMNIGAIRFLRTGG
ncbi:MAG: hypothetical protein GXO88_12450 [Chlorobi bacterium]|nr:hypothetical protein [Chlorobiota bacterium]